MFCIVFGINGGVRDVIEVQIEVYDSVLRACLIN